jgi:hypothetical protein
MRDAERIDPVLSKISAIWKKYPDLRLGQLIVNLLPSNFRSDPFYVEDEWWIAEIDRRLTYLENENKS